MGKLFCRVCKVKGSDAADQATDLSERPEPGVIPSRATTPANSGDESAAGSGSASEGGLPKRSRKKTETMAEMVSRVKRFVKVSAHHSVVLDMLTFYY